MRGKIAFVLGAAIGYVLGTRAGRKRYEQIKNIALTLWRTDAVQNVWRRVRLAGGRAGARVRDRAWRAAKDVLKGDGSGQGEA